jgi:hypothetical protein
MNKALYNKFIVLLTSRLLQTNNFFKRATLFDIECRVKA